MILQNNKFFRQTGAFSKENLAWLEKVFRDNVGEGKKEFTLQEFKKIVPSKNVNSLTQIVIFIYIFLEILC